MSPSKARANERSLRTILFYSGHLQHERERPDIEWIYMNIDKVQRKEPELTTYWSEDRWWWHKHTKQARVLRDWIWSRSWNSSVKHFILRIRFIKISLFGMILIRLKLHQFFNGVARTFPTHKHGRRKRGQEFQKFSKKLFSPFWVVKKQISPLLAPPAKIFRKIH